VLKVRNDMKDHLFLIFFSLLTLTVNSQSYVSNGNFENWILNTYYYPQNYPNNSNIETFLNKNLSFNVIRTTDRFHGAYAVKLSTTASSTDTAVAYLANIPKNEGVQKNFGIPYNEIPTGLRGYYKYNVETADSGLIIIAFSKGGNIIESYFFKLGGIHNSYTPFDFKFKPQLSQIPDSIIFGVTSSNIFASKPIPGSTLFLDSLSFSGVTSQPVLFNGDFESWLNETLYSLTSWHSDKEGIKRTTDSFNGIYAVELKTYLGYENNLPAAIPGRVSTGYYSKSGDCLIGGYPCSIKKDALVFYYKYFPVVSTDSAEVVLSFKKNGLVIGGVYTKLQPSASYKYAEVPFDLPSAPDTMIVSIQSSLKKNKAVTYVGAVLKIDELNFKSQNLATAVINNNDKKNDIQIYPNPTSGKFTLQIFESSFNLTSWEITVKNITGQNILKCRIKSQKTDHDISAYPAGPYFILINHDQSIHTVKIIKY
jgi:hypothetical protein